VQVVAGPETAVAWEAVVRPWVGAAIALAPPLARADLAALSARRAARSESTANLLPLEHASRYHQQFVDRLWMRGLFGVLSLYALGVLIYFAAVAALGFQKFRVDNQIAAVAEQFQQAQKMKARVQVLQEQVNLKFAALDCWKAVAELLPTDVTLENLAFQHGKLTLAGTVSTDQSSEVNDYNEALSKATVNGAPLFSKVAPPSSHTAGQSANWNFTCDVRRMEVE
jgi:hypothetical protein